MEESETGAIRITMLEALEKAKAHRPISSGSKGIDSLLGGGYRIGELVEVFGESKTGKTQLAMQAALSAASRGFSVLFVDTEGTFRPERAEKMSEARGWSSRELLSRIFHVRAADCARQLEVVKLAGQKKEIRDCRMIIVDTVTENFSLQYPGRRNVPRRQGILSVYLSRLARDAFINGRAVLLTNRVTAVMTERGGGQAHVGGTTLTQMVHKTIVLRRDGDKIRAALIAGEAESEPVEGTIGAGGFN